MRGALRLPKHNLEENHVSIFISGRAEDALPGDCGQSCCDLLAGRHIAGDRDHVDLRMVDEIVADRMTAASDDVDHALGQLFGKDLGHLQRGEGRLLG